MPTDNSIKEPEREGESALGAAARRLAEGYSALRQEDSARATKDRAAVESVGPRTTPGVGEVLTSAREGADALMGAAGDAAERVTTRRTDVDKAMQGAVDRGEPDTRTSYPVGEPVREDFKGAGGFTYRKTPEGIEIVAAPENLKHLAGLVVRPEGKNKTAYDAIMAEMEGAKK